MDTIYFRKLYELVQIPVFAWNGRDRFCLPEGAEYQSPLSEDATLRETAGQAAGRSTGPVLLWEDSEIFYGVLQSGETCIVFGPVSRHALLPEHLAEYCHQHRLTAKQPLRVFAAGAMQRLLSLVFYQLAGADLAPEAIRSISHNREIDSWKTESDAEEYQLESSEMEQNHNSAAYEMKLCDLVRDGDVAGMQKMLSADSFDTEHSAGQVAVRQSKRMEYLLVSLLTILSRAAVEGGMGQEASYELSDLYMRKLESCRTVDEMMMLGAKAQLEFTQRVRAAKERRDKPLYIEECKDYIAQNLRKPFRVGDIAPAIGVSRSYLARRFSEVEGMTIQQYVMQERCRHAANLLKYSKYPISIIAEYFCFSSQSHFGRQFRLYYGMTPNEYRRQNQAGRQYTPED